MTRAAGILFLTKGNCALFLKRGPGGDYPGSWCFPGGHVEPTDADVEAAAVREAIEEIGSCPDGVRTLHTRRISSNVQVGPMNSVQGTELNPVAVAPPAAAPSAETVLSPAVSAETVDFTTFLQRVPEPFAVELSEESVGYAWAPVGSPPQPTHPGCRIALDRLSMDELGVARNMAAGELTSPQQYANVTLFAIRITGTGAAYRNEAKDDKGKTIREAEYVWRDPSIYMNDEFLARCNGLPVIFEHPKKATLDSDEFAKRIVGTVFLPYLRTELQEVWAIAKLYDDEAVAIMQDDQMSTSPAVVLRDADCTKLRTEDGKVLLIEGNPKLLDHIAVCSLGVWDRGGDPRGVESTLAQDIVLEDAVVTISSQNDYRLDSAIMKLRESRLDAAYHALMRRA